MPSLKVERRPPWRKGEPAKGVLANRTERPSNTPAPRPAQAFCGCCQHYNGMACRRPAIIAELDGVRRWYRAQGWSEASTAKVLLIFGQKRPDDAGCADWE